MENDTTIIYHTMYVCTIHYTMMYMYTIVCRYDVLLGRVVYVSIIL